MLDVGLEGLMLVRFGGVILACVPRKVWASRFEGFLEFSFIVSLEYMEHGTAEYPHTPHSIYLRGTTGL